VSGEVVGVGAGEGDPETRRVRLVGDFGGVQVVERFESGGEVPAERLALLLGGRHSREVGRYLEGGEHRVLGVAAEGGGTGGGWCWRSAVALIWRGCPAFAHPAAVVSVSTVPPLAPRISALRDRSGPQSSPCPPSWAMFSTRAPGAGGCVVGGVPGRPEPPDPVAPPGFVPRLGGDKPHGPTIDVDQVDRLAAPVSGYRRSGHARPALLPAGDPRVRPWRRSRGSTTRRLPRERLTPTGPRSTLRRPHQRGRPPPNR